MNPEAVGFADSCLRRAVLARLIADPLVSTGHIGVAAIAGRVTLSGYVTSNAQKDAASAATRGVKGVEQVADEVSVAVPCSAAADPAVEDIVIKNERQNQRTAPRIIPAHRGIHFDASPDALKGKLPGGRCLIVIGTESQTPGVALDTDTLQWTQVMKP